MSTAVRFDHVDKSFRFFSSPLQRLRDVFVPFGRSRYVPVPVLHDITVDIPRGQTVAIIGANGAGKSTMLHLVAGLLEPSAGRVVVDGRVTAILELGGGFLPDLTGRENARFYDRVVGRGRAGAAARERAIEELAGIGEFFDRPVHTYSSGMFLRLAFAAAACEDPDILLIDEALAVGDARFQQQCYQRLRELRARGTTILLVTHAVEGLASVCERVLVLENGRIAFDGDPARGIDRYYQLFFTAPERPTTAGGELRYGDGGAAIVDPAIERSGDVVRIAFDVEFTRAVAAPEIGVSCSTKEGMRIYATTTTLLGGTPRPAAAGERRRVEIELRAGVTVSDLFFDLSVFEVVHGKIVVLDTRVGVLHLSLTLPRNCIGITDLNAIIRESSG
ncbi:MAG TPA: ABC transporter ATP-binding protein [Thermoanaerobaculia bacterium]|nr:ABC transporter ATP-binding protein [Thermoanaerobaculia bacterium]